MTPERWTQIEELFHRACESDSKDLDTLLDEACRTDPELRREVEALLASEESASEHLHDAVREQLETVGFPLAGETISHYRILGGLSGGGMGLVYRAEDIKLGRLVALKFLPEESVKDSAALGRFEREARAASALEHPNICAIYEFGEHQGQPFLVMQLLEGQTLREFISAASPGNPPLSLSKLLDFAMQITAGLEAAHQKGIIHRDIKPANLFVTSEGQAKILDFGLAKLASLARASKDSQVLSHCDDDEHVQRATEKIAPMATPDAFLSLTGAAMGTAGYMSPEQVRGEKLDARTDLFSFGLVLYEMATGQRAFKGDTGPSLQKAILNETPASARESNPKIPSKLEKIIDRALIKDREGRYQSASELHADLEALRREIERNSSVGWPAIAARRWWPWAAALVAVIGLGGGILWFVRPAPKIPEPRLTVTPLTASRDPEGEPSFSPDGHQVAFMRREKGQESHIYVKLIGTGGPPLRLTTGPVSDYSPAWSPDGRYIAFLRQLSSLQKNALLLVPALGGAERKIAEVFPSGLNCTDLTWLPDGNSLVIGDRNSPKEPTGLFLLAIDTGEKRRLTSPPFPANSSVNGDSCPSLSPDGRTLAFIRTVDASGDLYLLAVSNDLKVMGEGKRIELGHHSADAPIWTEDGREIIFWDTMQQSGLWRIDVSGSASRSHEPQSLVALGENAADASISRRGHRLAYTSFSSHSSIWRISAPDGSKTREEKSVGSVIYSMREDSAPEFSPDGKRIAFMSNRSVNWEIWVCDSDGSNPVQLTSFRGARVTNPRWSPDGGRIAFDSDAEGKQFDIWVINASGGKPKRMTTDPANDGNPSWSGDGRWIYFDSARTGEQQVWKIPEAGGDAIQITRDGGFAPLESPDGKFIYYTKTLVGTSVWRLPVEGGQPTKVLENLGNYLNLVLVNKGIYFIPSQDRDFSIQFLDFATNHTKRVASFGKPFGSGLALSPDGQWILYTQVDQAVAELRLVENFR